MAYIKDLINIGRKIISEKFHGSVRVLGSERRIVSFTFDDVPKSTFENAVPILNKYKLSGTFYIALSLMEGISDKKLYTKENLQKCVDSGHELACHSFNHIHFFETTNTDFIKADLKKNENTLETLGLNASFENFSYPYGEQTIISKRVVSRIYKSCRGTDNGINSGRVDLNSLKGIKLYENKNSKEKIDLILEKFNPKGGWLVFYTHDVQENYTSGGCSPEYFEYVIKKCLEAGFEIKSIKQGIASL